MVAILRAGLLAALLSLLLVPLVSAATTSPAPFPKPFQRDDLADAAIRLEGQIKQDAGTIAKPLAALERQADDAFGRNDYRAALAALGQAVTLDPQNTADWLRLAHAIRRIWPANDTEKLNLYERAAAAAYIAYQRTKDPGEAAEALLILSGTFEDRKIWRPALDALRYALELHEDGRVRANYEHMRDEHGFRLLDYTVDADSASPRACFQFSENLLSRRTDFSPFIAVAGQDKPALSADDKQLCVEGLKHGERYQITLRAGLPSAVAETLTKSADFSIYVRDRKPFVHFASKAYVLPRTGQRGIPVVSVNTDAVAVEIYRIGDRNLIDTLFSGSYRDADFQHTLNRNQLTHLADTQGSKVWKGELKVENKLNADITTAFPVDQAVGTLAPGVYVMTAEPARNKANDDYEDLATQWFVVSDLGVTAYSGSDGVHAFVHSLASTDARAGIEVKLIARNNEVLAVRKTDASGAAVFEPGLTRGEGGMAPALLVAADAAVNDFAFLSLKGPAFDLSDRGVNGRAVPAGLDAFVYTERGVYRTGEVVHITSLLRDRQGIAATGVPLTLVVERPDGVEYRRATVADQGVGGHNLDVGITTTASTGTWHVAAYTDPKGAPVGETSFLVEDYVPDRIEFDLKSQATDIAKNAPVDVTVDGRFLYGAPASALDLEGEVTVKAVSERPGFAGYQFGTPPDEDADKEARTTQAPLADLPATDDKGHATFQVAVDKLPQTTQPLQATVTVRMAEAGGRAVERKLTLPVRPSAAMIGVKPLFNGRSLGEGDTASFDVVMASPDGKTVARKLHYELFSIETRYQWYKQDNAWQWEPVKATKRVADGDIDVAADKPGRIAAPLVSWGRYRLEVSTGEPDGPMTTFAFTSGWYSDATADTPDMLEIALDKPDYKVGDTMTVAVTARTAGRLMLNIVGDRLISSTTQEVKLGSNQIHVPVGADWGNGGYVVATLLRPLDVAAKRMPGRAIGVQWFSVDRKGKTLAVDMKVPSLIRPNSTLKVPLHLAGLAGQDARVVVAAVDVGILNLTNYKPPAPDEFYLGQRRLTADIRDLYGQLLDGMQGNVGQLRTGGDGGANLLQAAPPTQPPLALYSGIVTVGADGNAEVSFDIGDFAGTVRVMAVAWSKDQVGRAVGDVIVRDPVVVTATLPRFILTGDKASLHLDVDNVDGAAGDYRVAIETDGPVAAVGGAQTLHLAEKQRTQLTVPITASGAGIANVKVNLAGPKDFALTRSYKLPAHPATQILVRRSVRPIAKGESITLTHDLFADLVPGTGAVSISVGPSTALDAATILKALDRYPFGCSEQITSRALPLLYANELAAQSHLAMDSELDQRIRDAIDRLLARQGSDGSFGLWAAGGDDAWLDAYVTDFLTRAREHHFAVPDVAFKMALDRLRNYVANLGDVSKNGGRELAYALYVLARNGAAPIGDLRYLADTKLSDIATPLAKAQIAAALGLMGDKARADRVYAAAVDSILMPTRFEWARPDYGSTLRDSAAVVTLAAEGGAPQATIMHAVARVEAARAISTYTSTQEDAWMVLAALALDRGSHVALAVNGEARTKPLYRTYRAADLAREDVKVADTGDVDLKAVVSVSGAPVTPEPPAEKGFKIERQYFTLEGEEVDASKVPQNTRLVVVLKVTEPDPHYGRVIVADYLPAGFEIDNPKLVSSGDTGALSWIEAAAEPVNAEFRDDHFAAAFDRTEKSNAVFSVAYVVRAVSPGQYVLPQAYVEDMYRPDRFGRTATGHLEVTSAK
ncbi:MAG TPA: alpha-2-macroglobulin [Xanthobacteraceae bacterium]|nr:alpha-2-macroglobulin [Xanthobacteraceae bacterium]